jgi:hypothetical protein
MTEVIKEYDYQITNPKTSKTRTKHVIRKYTRLDKPPRELKPNETMKNMIIMVKRSRGITSPRNQFQLLKTNNLIYFYIFLPTFLSIVPDLVQLVHLVQVANKISKKSVPQEQ